MVQLSIGGVQGFTCSSSSSGVTGFTRSTAAWSFFFLNTIAEKNVFTVLLLSYLYYKLWQYTRGLLQREMLRESHLACCLCKQMADKQKIMNGWMDGRKDNLFQHQHKCRHISKKITTNATINVGQSKYSHSFTRFVH